MKSDQLIPRKVIFGNPDKANLQLSKDGNYLSFLAPLNGVMNIFIAKTADIKSAKAITADKKRGIRDYFWSYDSKYIIYFKDNDGDENYFLHIIDLETKKEKIIKTAKDVKTSIVKTSQKYPEEIVIGLNERRKDLFDLYKLNLLTQEKQLIFQNDKYFSFNLDDDFNIIFYQLMNANGGVEIFDKNENPYLQIEHQDVKTTGVVGFSKDFQTAYFLDSRHRDKSALFKLNIADKKQDLLFASEDADVSSLILHPTTKKLQATGVEYLRNNIYTSYNANVFDENFAKDFNYLKQKCNNCEINITSRTTKDDMWIVVFVFDDRALEYYLFDRVRNDLKFLFCNRNDLADYKLNKMTPLVIKTRDGLNMVSYLTRPNKTGPVPMVLYVHGGPNARDSWGYNPTHQWLANRGYAVLSVNYRGSTGFGKNFTNAGDGQWAAKMHDDLIDAVNWAITEKITKKDKVAIMGGSYGGYAALVGLTKTPDIFACGVDIVGPSNLITLANSIPEYWKPIIKDMIIKIGGDPKTAAGREILHEKSPLFFVKNINKPLLIGQGANDPRVKQAESDQIVEQMEQMKIPVIYALYPDEGHGFQRPENRISFYALTEGFLSQCLSGKYEPIKTDFENSSLLIKSGKDYLPKNNF